MTLFRPESLHSQRQAWLGNIQLTQPVGLGWLTFGVLATMIATSTLFFLGEATRKAHLSGVLVPDQGQIRVVPPVAGTLVSLAVREGQGVQAGEVLGTLRVEAPSLNGGSQQDLLNSFAARTRSLDAAVTQTRVLEAARARALADRVDALRREMAQLDAQEALSRQRLALAEQALARLESLGRDQFVSSAQVQAKAEDVLGLKTDAAAIVRQQQALRRELSTLEADRVEVPLQAAQRLGELERSREEIAEAAARADAQAAERQLVLRAPAAGVVGALTASVGQRVTPDAALASLTPRDARLQAQLYAPSSAVGFLQVGQQVLLRVQAFPYQKFGFQTGTVLQVGQAPLQDAELADVAMPTRRGSEPMYRVTVALDRQTVPAQGQARALLPGMQLDADVVLEKRRLVEWLFEPLLGWSRRV